MTRVGSGSRRIGRRVTSSLVFGFVIDCPFFPRIDSLFQRLDSYVSRPKHCVSPLAYLGVNWDFSNGVGQ
jgi:hypothetical protein